VQTFGGTYCQAVFALATYVAIVQTIAVLPSLELHILYVNLDTRIAGMSQVGVSINLISDSTISNRYCSVLLFSFYIDISFEIIHFILDG